MNLTLVPTVLAKEGYRYTNHGDQNAEECDGCPVRTLCFKTPPGHYEVDTVRDVKHPCKLHEGTMQVCTVKEIPITTSLEAKHLKGTAANWAPIPCGYPECDRFQLCHPQTPAGHMEIVSVGEAIPCPMRYDIKEVQLRPFVPA
ncbi:MAG: UPF0179 family protein [Thermoplasmatota archaeon]